MKLKSIDRDSLIYVDGDFTVWEKVGLYSLEYPFQGDTENVVLTQKYMGYAEYYDSSRPQVGDVHPDFPELFWLYDSNFSDAGGAGIATIDRSWGTLPGYNPDFETTSTTIRMECESFPWTKPGVKTDNAVSMVWYVDRDQAPPTEANGNLTLSTTINIMTGERWIHNVQGNYNRVQIMYRIQDPYSGLVYDRTVVKPVITHSAHTITVESLEESGTKTYYSFCIPTVDQEPITKVVTSWLYYDYWLPGINVNSVEDIAIVQAFTIIGADNNETEKISETSDPPLYTNGNTKGWYDMIDDGDLLCAEASQIKRWRGNIWERVTRYIKAQ